MFTAYRLMKFYRRSGLPLRHAITKALRVAWRDLYLNRKGRVL